MVLFVLHNEAFHQNSNSRHWTDEDVPTSVKSKTVESHLSYFITSNHSLFNLKVDFQTITVCANQSSFTFNIEVDMLITGHFGCLS